MKKSISGSWFREYGGSAVRQFEHGALGELIHTALTDHALFAYVLTEEEIEHNAHHGQEYEHHQPSHGLHRLTVVHQHAVIVATITTT